jgi:hypothetical protein
VTDWLTGGAGGSTYSPRTFANFSNAPSLSCVSNLGGRAEASRMQRGRGVSRSRLGFEGRRRDVRIARIAIQSHLQFSSSVAAKSTPIMGRPAVNETPGPA